MRVRVVVRVRGSSQGYPLLPLPCSSPLTCSSPVTTTPHLQQPLQLGELGGKQPLTLEQARLARAHLGRRRLHARSLLREEVLVRVRVRVRVRARVRARVRVRVGVRVRAMVRVRARVRVRVRVTALDVGLPAALVYVAARVTHRASARLGRVRVRVRG